MKAREFHSSDWEMVESWWLDHEWQGMKEAQLAALGWVVESEECTPVCAGWLYVDPPLCWLEWIVSNPASRLRDRRPAIECLVGTAESAGKTLGAKVSCTALKAKSLIRLFGEMGWKAGDTGLTHMVKEL